MNFATDRALSIRQPWAWAVLHAGKTVENRSWPTEFRGLIYVHASRLDDLDSIEEFEKICRRLKIPVPNVHTLPQRALVGTVEITSCLHIDDVPRSNRWAFGEFCFGLANPQPLAQPIPMSGRLGFWRIPR